MSTIKTNISLKGERLKKIRERAGLTQTDFGLRVGCSQDNISKIELGESNPGRSLELLIGLQFGVNDAWLTAGQKPVYKDAAPIVAEPSEIYGGSKRARLVMLVKQLAATPGVQEKVIDALLKNVEVFLEVPTKEED